MEVDLNIDRWVGRAVRPTDVGCRQTHIVVSIVQPEQEEEEEEERRNRSTARERKQGGKLGWEANHQV